MIAHGRFSIYISSFIDNLEKEMATHSSILACRIPWTEEPGRVPVHGVARVRHDLVTKPPQGLLHNTENIANIL